jgi:hypothetical protein
VVKKELFAKQENIREVTGRGIIFPAVMISVGVDHKLKNFGKQLSVGILL